ncbi:MAG: GNAT family N-acetyltransferase [Patescibacteria group bacterium]
MKFITERNEIRNTASEAIRRYGYAPEHNVDWFLCATEIGAEAVFVDWPDMSGLLTHKKYPDFFIFSEPVIPEDLAPQHLVECIEYVFQDLEIKKIWFELRTPIRKRLLAALPQTVRANSINYALTWPVMNMDAFDPNLPGKHFKSIRNAKNAFYRDHKVEVIDARICDKAELHSLIDAWKKARRASDRAYPHTFHNLADTSFKGMDEARVIVVDGRVRGINAGWMISNSDIYYGSVGLHDYSEKDLGLMIYLEDLMWLKSKKYHKVDMGGGEKALTVFKNQFLPESWYKTFVFSIVRR